MLEAFTLFETSKGWQRSVREKGERGWSVIMVSEDRARRMLSVLDKLENNPDSNDLMVQWAQLKPDAQLWAAMWLAANMPAEYPARGIMPDKFCRLALAATDEERRACLDFTAEVLKFRGILLFPAPHIKADGLLNSWRHLHEAMIAFTSAIAELRDAVR